MSLQLCGMIIICPCSKVSFPTWTINQCLWAAAQIHIINDITALFKAGEVIVEYEHQYLIFGQQQDKMDAPLLSFFLSNSLCVCVVVCMYSTVRVSDRTPLGSARNLAQGESDRATQKVGGKTTYFMCSVPLCAIITVEAGRSEGEGEPSLMKEEEEMKLHLFWWLTNDFEMWVDLARRQNHFPNNTAWSLNKQNWDAALMWRRDGLLCWDTNNPSGCVCAHLGVWLWSKTHGTEKKFSLANQ